jgi:tRNA-specific 2-thiouridylase
MSGGVDSSVVAALLQAEGYEVVGVSMRLYRSGSTGSTGSTGGSGAAGAARGCCSPDDLYDARSVAETLGVPFYVVNYQGEFERRVIDHFVAEYRRGRTPSPCVLCNNHVKFDSLLSRTAEIGASRLATGHYARIDCEPATGRWRLRRGLDPVKDQSYFLFGIERVALSQLMFPLGGLTKERVRRLAERFGLPTAHKAESQDLCFVGGAGHVEFLERQLPEAEQRPGPLVHVETGEVLGFHLGIHRFTVGQRRGLGISYGEPLYVTSIEADTSRVLVGPRRALESLEWTLTGCNWLAIDELTEPVEGVAQIRYRHRPVPATVEPLGPGRARIRFAEPEGSVTPGQAAVLYREDEVIGGGWIDTRTA